MNNGWKYILQIMKLFKILKVRITVNLKHKNFKMILCLYLPLIKCKMVKLFQTMLKVVLKNIKISLKIMNNSKK